MLNEPTSERVDGDGAQRLRIWHGQASTTYLLITISLFNPIPQSAEKYWSEHLALGV